MSKLFISSREGHVVQVHGLAHHKLLSSSHLFLIYVFSFVFSSGGQKGSELKLSQLRFSLTSFLYFLVTKNSLRLQVLL